MFSNLSSSSISLATETPSLVVRRVEIVEKTTGGLIIPDSAQEKPAVGEVVSVGYGAIDDKGN